MTVATQVTRVIVAGDGTTTVFSFSFPIPGSTATDQTNAELTLLAADGTITDIADNLWSITGVGTAVGGTFTFPLSGPPIAVGVFLILNRVVPYLQPTELTAQGAYSPAVVMSALDNLAFQTEQLNTLALQTVHAPITDAALNDLPPAVLRANRYLGFDNSGQPIVSGVVNTASMAGGSNGQIQYNSSGALAGFTMSGDMTLVPTTGVATLSTSGVTAGSYTASNITVDAKGRVTAAASGSGGAGVPAFPQGRLTLQSAHPVMTGDQLTKTTVFYDSYVGNSYPAWNGSAMAAVTITADEISCGLDAGVPHVASGSLYDVFGTSSGAIGVGPAWTSTTARGSGAGTTQLALKAGVWTNAVSLTHLWGGASGVTDLGPISANQATYLGTIYATANGQTGVAFKPAAASGGSNNILGLYNAYNQVPVTSREKDSSATWNYGSATWRSSNGSTSNRISWVDGLQQSFVAATAVQLVAPGSSGQPQIGIAFDATTGTPDVFAAFSAGAAAGSIPCAVSSPPLLGLHFAQQMENDPTATTDTWFAGGYQALTVTLEM